MKKPLLISISVLFLVLSFSCSSDDELFVIDNEEINQQEIYNKSIELSLVRFEFNSVYQALFRYFNYIKRLEEKYFSLLSMIDSDDDLLNKHQQFHQLQIPITSIGNENNTDQQYTVSLVEGEILFKFEEQNLPIEIKNAIRNYVINKKGYCLESIKQINCYQEIWDIGCISTQDSNANEESHNERWDDPNPLNCLDGIFCEEPDGTICTPASCATSLDRDYVDLD